LGGKNFAALQHPAWRDRANPLISQRKSACWPCRFPSLTRVGPDLMVPALLAPKGQKGDFEDRPYG
jgi:hypothetical protein